MCGSASSAQSNLAGQSGKFYTELSGAYNTAFDEHEAILSQLHDAWTPIFDAGIGQAGWSPTEAAAINTNAIDTNAAAYSHAANATAEALAARGGGSEALPSGVDSQIQAGVAEKAAGDLAATENANTVANYQTGRQNFLDAAGALSDVAKQENPTEVAKYTLQAGNQAFGEQTQIQAENNSWKNDLVGALSGSGGVFSDLTQLASSGGGTGSEGKSSDPYAGQTWYGSIG